MAAETPALSASIASILLSQSPLHAWSAHRLLGNVPRPETDAMRKGKLYHQLLVPGGARLEVFDYPSWQSKAAREARGVAEAEGKTPILSHKYEEAMAGVERIRERLRAEGVDLSNGNTELRLEWWEPALVGLDGVLCHGVLDWVTPDRRLIRDIKTTDGSVTREACEAAIFRGGGAIQRAAYISAVSRLFPDTAGRVEFEFIFCETREPYAVHIGPCAGSLVELGERQWSRAIELWAQCLRDDHWPGPGEGRTRFEAPAWALAAEMAREEYGT